jgi:hypothetical protein
MKTIVTAMFLVVACSGYGATLVLKDYNGAAVPRNGAGDTYPSNYNGSTAITLNSADSISGNSLQATMSTSNSIQLQFNPYNADDSRGYARELSANPSAWTFKTFNRLSFWVKRPPTANPLSTDGGGNVEFGTYVKQITNSAWNSDEYGGNHYYHQLNLPNNGQWTHVILNMHPDHRRGDSGGTDPGFLPYPTATNGPNGGEDPPATYNYFDTLTRFYFDEVYWSGTGTWLLDEFVFYQETAVENDVQVFSITSTYNPATSEILVTWKRSQDENDINHEVRYAFSDIHQIGWNAATVAPNGTITPPGWQG